MKKEIMSLLLLAAIGLHAPSAHACLRGGVVGSVVSCGTTFLSRSRSVLGALRLCALRRGTRVACAAAGEVLTSADDAEGRTGNSRQPQTPSPAQSR